MFFMTFPLLSFFPTTLNVSSKNLWTSLISFVWGFHHAFNVKSIATWNSQHTRETISSLSSPLLLFIVEESEGDAIGECVCVWERERESYNRRSERQCPQKWPRVKWCRCGGLELRNCIFSNFALDDVAFWIFPPGLSSGSSPPPPAFDDEDKVHQDFFGTLEGSRRVRI